jgi:hypothetical protein
MSKKNKILILVFMIANPFIALSAPFPGTSGSWLTRPQSGLFWASRGFTMGTEGTGWVMEQDELSKDSLKQAKNPIEEANYTHQQFPKAKFSIRVETLKADQTLETYSKKWSKEYHPYGFNLLGTRPFQHDEDKGLIYDLVSKSKPVQVRQVVFLHKKEAVILTCTDDKRSFSQSLKDCNQMVRKFKWAQAPKPELKLNEKDLTKD